MKEIVKFWSQHTAFAIGAVCSLVLLAIFLWFQYEAFSILKLESRWLIAASVPLLAGLVVGGYIKSFKGFGVELEASLKKSVTNIELLATDAMEQMDADEKRSVYYLEQLSEFKKKNITRLVFIQGRTKYYGSYAIEQYLKQLPSLRYFEIRNSDGRFIALLPVSVLMRDGDVQDRNVIFNRFTDFIDALEQNQVLQRYSSLLITQFVGEDAGIVESLQLMRKKRITEMAVLDEDKKFVGLLLSQTLEKRIADNVLAASENA